MSDQIVTTQEVTKRFRDGTTALDRLTLIVPRGVVFGLLGPNGAGKTTLIRILATLLRPDAGIARVAGFDVTASPAQVRARIGLAGQLTTVDDHLTGRENIAMIGRLYGLSRREAARRTEQMLERTRLGAAADRQVRTYSGGMRRRIDLAASLAGRPQLLFLDEPTTGIDPASRQDLWHLIRELAADGTTVLLTTQYLEEVDHLADRVAVVDRGRLITEGTTSELKDRTGSAVIELDIAEQLRSRAVEALEPLQARLVAGSGKIILPAPDGPLTLRHVLRALDQAKIVPVEVTLHRPTLDDVFLALTRQPISAGKPAS
jgi:daunorubicin resistance ABC transporter ATP-binding subunit